MHGPQSHDPLLGGLSSPAGSQNGRHGSTNGQKTATASGEDATNKAEPSPDVIRDAYATNLRDMTGATQLYVAVSCSLSDGVDPAAFKVYRDRLLQDVGNPTDPIEIMLIEQIAMAHFHIGRLHLKSCSVESPKLATAFADAANRLLGEFRRCTLALEDFRAKQAARRDRAATVDAVEKATPVGNNGKPREPSRNGKKKPANSKLRTNGEIPECIRQRMGYATNDASKQTVGIGGNGKG